MTVPARIIQRRLSSAAHAAALRRKAVEISGAPASIGQIPDSGTAASSSVFIRAVGCTRHVFLRDPHLSAAELEGLAYRLQTLSKNDSLNSVLITSTEQDNPEALAATMIDRDYPYLRNESADDGFPPEPGYVYKVLSGYDPLDLYSKGQHVNSEQLLRSISHLATALRGDAKGAKIPTISIPHGNFSDAGFALAHCTYVLATKESKFSIQNPSRGLSLDPVGLSYVLPKLGREFKQPAADYSGVGMLLALTGYVADANDLMEIGMATNYMETPHALGLLETTLSQIRPWNQQAMIKTPIRMLGQPEQTRDHNAEFRNVTVAETIHNFTSYRADGLDMWTHSDQDAYAADADPSLEDFDALPWHEARSSMLVNYAATFDDIFRSESTVVGLLERFRQVAARETNDPEEQECVKVAQGIVGRLEAQSPLALCVTHDLLQKSTRSLETLDSCMMREQRVQAKLLEGDDFIAWAQYQSGNKEEAFGSWKHSSVSEVTPDEVAELIGDETSPIKQALRGGPPRKRA